MTASRLAVSESAVHVVPPDPIESADLRVRVFAHHREPGSDLCRFAELQIAARLTRGDLQRGRPLLAAFIVGFADTPAQYQMLLARRAAHLTRAGLAAELVVIDQDSEAVIMRHDVWLIPGS
jgi:hypothetical protein